jgi:hypothetical protein
MKTALVLVAVVLMVAVHAAGADKAKLAAEMVTLADTQKKLVAAMAASAQQQFQQRMEELNLAADFKDDVAALQEQVVASTCAGLCQEKFQGALIKLVAETFSEADLQAIVKFYKSSAGQSLLKQQSALTQKALQLAQQEVAPALPEVQKMETAFMHKVVRITHKACQNNLRLLDGATQQYALDHTNALPSAMTDLVGTNAYIKDTPACKAGGVYTLPRTLGGKSSCSVHGAL